MSGTVKVKGYTATRTSRIKVWTGKKKYVTKKYKVKGYTKKKGKMGNNQHKKK
jgi:hypothetical protein